MVKTESISVPAGLTERIIDVVQVSNTVCTVANGAFLNCQLQQHS